MWEICSCSVPNTRLVISYPKAIVSCCGERKRSVNAGGFRRLDVELEGILDGSRQSGEVLLAAQEDGEVALRLVC